jgi:WD40 repeat protein
MVVSGDARLNRLPVQRLHFKAIRTLAWSPGGKRLAAGSRDRTVKIWVMSE